MTYVNGSPVRSGNILLAIVISVFGQSGSLAIGDDTIKPELCSGFTKALESQNDLLDLNHRLRQAVAANQNAVVHVGHGTGVIVSPDGFVLTAYHVVKEQPDRFQITVYGNRKVTARKCGYDTASDLAVLKIESAEMWPYAEMGYSTLVQPGQWYVSIGYPAHADSSKPPLVRLGRVLATSPYWVCGDSLFEGGDCGGPIFDDCGKIIAINRGGTGSSRGAQHLSIDSYRGAWDRLVRGDRFGDPATINFHLLEWIGCSMVSDRDLLQISMILPGMAADSAGLRSSDVVIACNHVRIQQKHELMKALDDARLRRQRAVTLSVERETNVIERSVRLDLVRRLPGMDAMREVFDGSTWLNRHPEVEQFQRNTIENQKAFCEVVKRASHSTIMVRADGVRNRLGTVVHREGYLVTSSAGLSGELTCQLADGSIAGAQVVLVRPEYGLALLKADFTSLEPVAWNPDEHPDAGLLVAVVQPNPSPLAFGVVSSEQRAMLETLSSQISVDSELRILSVSSDSKAQAAGMLAGDKIVSINGVEVQSSADLRTPLSMHTVGQPLTFNVQRERDDEKVLDQIIFPAFGLRDVFLHDGAVGPSHLGGPVVGIDGNAIGINVARSHEISICAAPHHVVMSLLDDALKNESTATKP